MAYKFFSRCECCKKCAILIKNRKVQLPINLSVTSKSLICRKCQKGMNLAITQGYDKENN